MNTEAAKINRMSRSQMVEEIIRLREAEEALKKENQILRSQIGIPATTPLRANPAYLEMERKLADALESKPARPAPQESEKLLSTEALTRLARLCQRYESWLDYDDDY